MIAVTHHWPILNTHFPDLVKKRPTLLGTQQVIASWMILPMGNFITWICWFGVPKKSKHIHKKEKNSPGWISHWEINHHLKQSQDKLTHPQPKVSAMKSCHPTYNHLHQKVFGVGTDLTKNLRPGPGGMVWAMGMAGLCWWSTRWCPSSLAKLVNITPIKPMVYGRYSYS
jgi:hypothetical protein